MKTLYSVPSTLLPSTDALDPSDTIYSGALAASTEQTVTVPAGAQFAIFSCTSDYYVNYDTTAAVPTGTISQAGGELNPLVRFVGDVTTLHIISDTSCKVTISFYSK